MERMDFWERIGVTIILFFLCFNSEAQLNLQYYPCKTCPPNQVPKTFRVNTDTRDVISDFGARTGSGISFWHRGIDLTIPGVEDLGYQIITPVSGVVAQLESYNGYIVLVIDGPGNFDLGYGHIFGLDEELLMKMGDLVLKTCEDNTSLAIINLQTQQAIGPVNGAICNYQGIPYVVSNQVVAGQVIASLGVSGTNYAHLHLYALVNPYGNPQDINNAKDPLQLLDHFNTQYTSVISYPYRLTMTGTPVYYPGDVYASIRVEVTMSNAGTLGAPPNQYYQTAVMDVDDVELFIRREGAAAESMNTWGSAQSAYQLIRGPNYFSRISHGARWSTTAYPACVTQSSGSVNKTGIDPSAYNSSPTDVFYFSDIMTRIHKGHVMGTTPAFAQVIDDARYPDGHYRLFGRVTRLNGAMSVTTLTGMAEITIDNFRPYIKKVKVLKDNSTTPFYQGKWNWNGSQLQYEQVQNGSCESGTDLVVKIYTSEPMKQLALKLGSFQHTSVTPLANTDQTEWDFQVPHEALIMGVNVLRISGMDIASNGLEGFTNLGPKQAGSFPVRQASGWSPQPAGSDDLVHKIMIEEVLPLVANFVPQSSIINPGESVVFLDASTGPVDEWIWSFPGGIPEFSEAPNPIVNYYYPGEYPVTLTVYGAGGYCSAVGSVIVSTETIEPVADFMPKNVTLLMGSEIHFFDLSTGNPDQWYWDFGSYALPSMEQNPVVLFDHEGVVEVTLTVANAAGVSTVSGTITIVQQSNMLEVMCMANPFLASPGTMVNLQGSVFNASPPFQYLFDFGDGFIQAVSSNMITESVSHVYTADGTYHPRVTVTDENNFTNYCEEMVTIMGGNPCDGLVPEFSCNYADFVAPVNAVLTFTDASSGGTPPYLHHWTFGADPLTGNTPGIAAATSQGPHTLAYTQAGNYPVSLHICDMNGCGLTVNHTITVYNPEHCLLARLNKLEDGKVITSLGNQTFYDFSLNNYCLSCQDPPGSGFFPCETNNHWQLYKLGNNTLLQQKYGFPMEDLVCNFLGAQEREFYYHFVQKGNYLLKLRVWDQTCNVMTGYDCQDETTLLVQVIDCHENIQVCNDNLSISAGLNQDLFAGTIEAGQGTACPMHIPANARITFKATREIILKDGFHSMESSAFRATITTCPGESKQYFEEALPQQKEDWSWEVFPNPTEGGLQVQIQGEGDPVYSLQVLNLLGKSLFSKECQGETRQYLPLGHLPGGIYILRYQTLGRTVSKKFVLLSQ